MDIKMTERLLYLIIFSHDMLKGNLELLLLQTTVENWQKNFAKSKKKEWKYCSR